MAGKTPTPAATAAPEATAESTAAPTPKPRIAVPNWDQITARLLEPFNPEDIQFRSLRYVKARNQGDVDMQEMAAYVSTRASMSRLDEIVGIGNWSYDFTPLVLDTIDQKVSVYDEIEGKNVNKLVPLREMTRAKGTLTIYGVSKSALGDSSNVSPSKGCDSDAFKRACVMWGLGRYLYDVERIQLQARYVYYGMIDPGAIDWMRATMIPHPEGYTGKYAALRAQFLETGQPASENEPVPDEAPRRPAASPATGAPAGSPPRKAAPSAPQRPPAKDGAQERIDAIADLGSAIAEKGLPTHEEMLDWQTYAYAQYLKCSNEDAALEKLSTKQIVNITGAIRAGRIDWQKLYDAAE